MSVNVKTEEGLLMVAGKPYDGNYVTPQMFGAKGDGEHDDTARIVSAISYANSNGKSVYFPKGEYVVTSAIEIPVGFEATGTIASWSEISTSESNGAIIKLSNNGCLKVKPYAQLSNIALYGTGAEKALHIDGGRSYVHDITIMNANVGICNTNCFCRPQLSEKCST